MDARLIAEAAAFRAAERRLLDAGLVLDPAAFSREHRRALAVLRRVEEAQPRPVAADAPRRVIGFAYPSAR
jgi:hypothetical protein